MPLGAIAAGLGIFNGVRGLFGGGQQGGSSSSRTYVPTGLGSADQTFQNLLTSGANRVQGANQTLDPALMQALSQYLGLNTSGLTATGNYAGSQYGNLVGDAMRAQNALGANAGNIGAAGNQIWQTALDPQNALHDRMQQQVQDSSRAATSARGIGTGGVSAGIENQALSNFNQDWQNQQLQRQLYGLQGMGSAFNQAGQQYAGSLNAGALAPYFTQQAGQVPYQSALQAVTQPFNAAQSYFGATQPGMLQSGNLMNSIIQYLNQGQGATGQAFNQGQQNLGNAAGGLAYFGGNQGQQALANLGNIFQPQPTYNSGGGGWTSGFDLPMG